MTSTIKKQFKFWANGDQYEGEFSNGMKNGKGLFIWSNGNKYDGDWKDNQRHGKGNSFLIRLIINA